MNHIDSILNMVFCKSLTISAEMKVMKRYMFGSISFHILKYA